MFRSFTLFFLLFSTLTMAKPTVVVSVLPQQTFVQKIAKDLVDITLMVTPGASPHSYEPKASQMIALSHAQVYFSIGVEFEEAWLDRFESQNHNLKFVDMSQGITKIAMHGHHHHHEENNEEDEHHDELDPHTWTSPTNVSKMAHTIYKTLVMLDPEHKQEYKTNLSAFINEIKDTDEQIKELLKSTAPKSKFMVFHPSWGYFANEYGLEQVAVEVEGKKPKPKEMINIIKEAKEEQVKVIFTQPEFSDKSAQIIAKEAGVRVQKLSPLSADWSQNLINMAKAIANK